MSKIKPGDQFGDWTALSEAHFVYREPTVNCRCACGQVQEVKEQYLLEGTSEQCWKCRIAVIELLPDGKTLKGYLANGMEYLIDKEDAYVTRYGWAATRTGAWAYALRKGNRSKGEPRSVNMHRQIIGVSNSVHVDHINGNTLDNRKANLRIADVQTNSFNRKKPNVNCTSVYKGVFRRTGSDVWTSRIKLNNRLVELGLYENEVYGAMAYNVAARLLFGEYCRCNDVPDAPLWIKIKVEERCQGRMPEARAIRERVACLAEEVMESGGCFMHEAAVPFCEAES